MRDKVTIDDVLFPRVTLNTNVPIPLYYQLKMQIKEMIEQGELLPGSKLPSEDQIARMCDLSRMTVRQALKEIAQEGLIRRVAGRGSFVSDPRIQQSLTKLTSFTEDMKSRGLEAGAKVLSAQIVQTSDYASKKLNIPLDAQLVELIRLRLANKQPLAVETTFIPFFNAPDFLNQDLTQSITGLLEHKYNLRTIWAKQEMEASYPSAFQAKLLNITTKSPILKMKRLYYAENGQPTHYVDSIYRSDRYKFVITLKR